MGREADIHSEESEVQLRERDQQTPELHDRVVADLHKQLNSAKTKLVGCQRRNQLTEADAPWTMYSGNAYLDLVGHRTIVKTPIDLQVIWIREGTLIEFRGGPMRQWWWDDMYELWALTIAYSGHSLEPVVFILNEYKGVMNCYRSPVHQFIVDDPKGYAVDSLEEWTTGPSRLAKNSQRAYHVCRTCPTKRQCDIIDKTTLNGNDDWGPGYPFP